MLSHLLMPCYPFCHQQLHSTHAQGKKSQSRDFCHRRPAKQRDFQRLKTVAATTVLVTVVYSLFLISFSINYSDCPPLHPHHRLAPATQTRFSHGRTLRSAPYLDWRLSLHSLQIPLHYQSHPLLPRFPPR